MQYRANSTASHLNVRRLKIHSASAFLIYIIVVIIIVIIISLLM